MKVSIWILFPRNRLTGGVYNSRKLHQTAFSVSGPQGSHRSAWSKLADSISGMGKAEGVYIPIIAGVFFGVNVFERKNIYLNGDRQAGQNPQLFP